MSAVRPSSAPPPPSPAFLAEVIALRVELRRAAMRDALELAATLRKVARILGGRS